MKLHIMQLQGLICLESFYDTNIKLPQLGLIFCAFSFYLNACAKWSFQVAVLLLTLLMPLMLLMLLNFLYIASQITETIQRYFRILLILAGLLFSMTRSHLLDADGSREATLRLGRRCCLVHSALIVLDVRLAQECLVNKPVDWVQLSVMRVDYDWTQWHNTLDRDSEEVLHGFEQALLSERERERHIQTQTETQTDRETERQRYRERQKRKQRQTETDRDRQTEAD